MTKQKIRATKENVIEISKIIYYYWITLVSNEASVA